MAANIEVSASAGGYAVTVRGGATLSRHFVSASASDLARLAPGVAPERAIQATFRFLLDREPQEAILTRFDIQVVSRYFPEFESHLAEYLLR